MCGPCEQSKAPGCLGSGPCSPAAGFQKVNDENDEHKIVQMLLAIMSAAAALPWSKRDFMVCFWML